MTDQEIIKEARDHMALVSQMEFEIREESKRCQEFRALQQWPPNAADTRGSRPTLTYDQTGQYIDQVNGDWRRNRMAIKVTPCEKPADPEVARILNGWIRQTQYVAKFHLAFDWAFECMIGQNRGFVKMTTKRRPGSFKQDVRFLKIANPDCVYMDPFCRESDYSDQRRTLITDRYSNLAMQAEFGASKDKDGNPVITDFAPYVGQAVYGDWVNKESCLVGEYWRVEEEPRKIQLLNKPIAVTRNGRITMADTVYDNEYRKLPEGVEVVVGPDGQRMEDDEPLRKVWQYILTAWQVIDKTLWPGQFIPVIPMMGKELYHDGKKRLYALISRGLDAQRTLNYAVTSMAERLQQFPKNPLKGMTGQFKTDGDKWAKANTTPYAYLQWDPVPLADGTIYAVEPKATDVDPRLDQSALVTQVCKDLLKGTIGMYGSSLGQEDPKAKSGVAIEALQREGDNATFDYMDNGGRAIELAGKMMVDIAPHILSGPDIIQIRDEQEQTIAIAINQPINPKEHKNQEQEFWLNQITNAEYAVDIGAAPSHETLRQEGQRMMMEMLEYMSPEERQLAMPTILRMSDAFGAKELANKMDPPDSERPDPKIIAKQLQDAVKMIEIQAETIKELQDAEDAKTLDNASKEKIAALNAKVEVLKIEASLATAEAQLTSKENIEQMKDATMRDIQQMETASQAVLQVSQQAHESTMAEQQAETAQE